jgi:hypothetical protein
MKAVRLAAIPEALDGALAHCFKRSMWHRKKN